MQTVYDFVTVICFGCVVLTYFMFTEGGMKVLAHFMLPAAAFVQQFLATFKDFPPRQRPASFSIDQVLQSLQLNRAN